MSRVEELLHAFTAEFRAAGDADPRPYLRQVGGADRAELVALIDHFLATAPAPAFDPDAFAAFTAQPERAALVDRVLADQSLVELRRAAGLTKAQVGTRLADALELAAQASAVKGAYHDLEAGRVEPERVRERIVTLLARLYDTTAEQVRGAVRVAFQTRPSTPGAAFARSDEPLPGAPQRARPRTAAGDPAGGEPPRPADDRAGAAPPRAGDPAGAHPAAVREAFFVD